MQETAHLNSGSSGRESRYDLVGAQVDAQFDMGSDGGIGGSKRGLGDIHRKHTERYKFRHRWHTLERIADGNDPNVPPVMGSLEGAVKGAFYGGAILGPAGAIGGALVNGLEFKLGTRVFSLATIPGAVLEFLDENTGFPFSLFPEEMRKWMWEASNHVFPEATQLLAFVVAILSDDVKDPSFCTFVPSDKWWKRGEQVTLQRHQIFGSSATRSAIHEVKGMDNESKMKFFDALDHVGRQVSSLAGMDSHLSETAQKIEIAMIGHLVGSHLAKHRITSEGIIPNLLMRKKDKDGDIYYDSVNLDLKNRDDVAMYARSLLIGTKYEGIKTTAEKRASTDVHSPGSGHDPSREAAEKAEAKSASEKLLPALLAAGIGKDQILQLLGFSKTDIDSGRIELDKSGDGKQLQFRMRDTSDGSSFSQTAEQQFTAEEAKLAAYKGDVIKEARALGEKGVRISQEELTRGIDFGQYRVGGETVDMKGAGYTINLETMTVTATLAGGKMLTAILSMDETQAVRGKLALADMEHSIAQAQDPAAKTALVGKAAKAVEAADPTVKVFEKDNKLFAFNPATQTINPLDMGAIPAALVAAQAEVNAPGAGVAAGGGGSGKPSGRKMPIIDVSGTDKAAAVEKALAEVEPSGLRTSGKPMFSSKIPGGDKGPSN